MANSEDVQRDEERRTLIRLALGKASVAFMRQSAEVVMPTEELLEVAEDIHAVWALEVDNLAAEVRELRRDRARLDWLEGEAKREMEAVKNGLPLPRSLFRQNCCILRMHIDAAMGGGEKLGGE